MFDTPDGFQSTTYRITTLQGAPSEGLGIWVHYKGIPTGIAHALYVIPPGSLSHLASHPLDVANIFSEYGLFIKGKDTVLCHSHSLIPPNLYPYPHLTMPTSSPVTASPPPLSLNPALQRMQYAVRGKLVRRAADLSVILKGPNNLPFPRIIYCNIGNPQSVGQKPITYLRQLLAVIAYPPLLESNIFPPDIIARASEFLNSSNGLGAYSASPGVPYIRTRIAEALTRRDNVLAKPESIFLTNGASEAVKAMLNLLIRTPEDGIMLPIPQYPLYSATMTALRAHQVSYYLDEADSWRVSISHLEEQLNNARAEGVNVRAIVIINPGNPTGQLLTLENLRDIISFCEREDLVILADEVYQKNVYMDGRSFVSFKKVACEMESMVRLASFHSISKGLFGECGMRGGFVELVNMDQEVLDVIYKVFSVSLCSNIMGQVAMDVSMNPPVEGEPSYALYKSETDGIYNELKRKAAKLSAALNQFKGVSCNASQGAMYLFPSISLPEKAKEEAKRLNMCGADMLYCSELLEATGICVVPGSGFGQMEGSLHFRTTFLPSEEEIDGVIESMHLFHNQFLDKYC